MFKKRLVVLLVLIVFILQPISSPFVVQAAGDGEPPVVESLEVSPQTANVGETISVRAKVSDENSGVKSVVTYFKSPSGHSSKYVSLRYNSDTSLWEGKLTIGQYDEEGQWQFNFMPVEDHAGNSKWLYKRDLQNTTQTDYKVVNPNGDGDLPLVESVKVSPQEVKVGDKINVQVKVTDLNSGVDSVVTYFKSPTGKNSKYVSLHYNTETSLWEGNFTILTNDEEGQWQFNFMPVEDHAGNSKWFYKADILDTKSSSFIVTNPDGDGEPPVVQSLEVSPQVVEVGDTVYVKAKVSDNNSGVKSATVYMKSPSGNNSKYISLRFNAETALWEGKTTIGTSDQEGKWNFSFMPVEDNAGNSKWIYIGEIQDWSKLDFTIQPPEITSLDPLPIAYTKYNEYWSEKTIKGDLYIGPNSEVTIKGNVRIEGDVYVHGILKNYGNLTITGTLNAKRAYYGSSSSLPGTVLMLGGTNSIPSMSFTSYGWEVPLEIYSQNLTVKNGHLDLEGATLPIVDLYANGQRVELSHNGTFEVSLDNITTDKVAFKMVDGFGHEFNKVINVIDTMPPAKVTGLKVNNKSDTSLTISWDKNAESDLSGYNIYLNGTKVDSVSKATQEYSFKNLKASTNYKIAIESSDSSNNKSEKAEISATTMLPTPKVNNFDDNDEYMTGTAVKNVTINVYKGKEMVGTGQSSDDGTFKIKLPKQQAGTILKIIAENKTGNKSSSAELTVKDVTAPDAPKVGEVTDKSTNVTGQAEAGSSITITKSGSQIGTGKTKSDDTFEVEIPMQKAGTLLSITSKDPSGNSSKATEVKVVDVTEPAAPQVNQVTDQSVFVTGKAEAGATVKISTLQSQIGSGKAGQDGSFKVEIERQKSGTVLTVKAIDLSGNTSKVTNVTVGDVTAPSWPANAKMTLSKVGDQSLTIQWPTATDNSSITSYKIYQDEKLVQTVPSSTKQLTISNLLAAHSYEYRVEAGDQAGNWTKGPSVIAKTTGKYVERISGINRFETATAISKSEWKSADTVLLAKGYDFPDALAGVPLANKLNAPILLTDQNTLSKETAAELKRLQAKKVIILGGKGAIATKVENDIKSLGIKIERISGIDRFETAAKIAERLGGNPEKAIIAYGYDFPDALAISSFAASKGYPILLSQTGKLPETTKQALKGVKETIVVGGTKAINKSVENQLPEPLRINGKDRFETAISIIEKLNISKDKVYVATGYQFADALTDSVIAAQNNAPILLVQKESIPQATKNLIEKYDISNFTILGGKGAVSEELF